MNERLLAVVALVVAVAAAGLLYARYAHLDAQPSSSHIKVVKRGFGNGREADSGGSHGRRSSVLTRSRLWIWLPASTAVGLLGAVAIGARRRRRLRARDEDAEIARVVSVLVLESLDDLRRERDARRAVIACYARMEGTLARVGSGREPFETPFEYMERVLVRLRASADSVRCLTHLFEEAKFSRQVVNERMRGRAIDALTNLQRELRPGQA
jgi:hypothetical protein